ncbi:MAG TPA: TIGR02530 family flagellar biosynthesis protein [Bacillota bacterium]|jgi:flagellar operon protein|nr:TIGR02530 family flagellar biosynthesis protein [Bacillota bacterium]HOL10014.1 TIGR02530 family flagellar biosynthesis protein [Bacillota bacterium]HPO97763.1 TIGR02530 family flagellar biosynthesis protein [Bacillota bacterium]
MNDKIFIRPPQIGPVTPRVDQKSHKPSNINGTDFSQVFQEQLQKQSEVKFSAHALKRLEDRNISLGNKELSQLKDAVNRAEAKGAKESLILMDNLALIVSIKNRTVITAVDGDSLKENVFTNIDSAVIVN